MQLTRLNVLWHAQSICAKIWHYARRKPAIKDSALPPLTAHIARDIGLSISEQERLRHRWPSQNTQHPYL